MSIGKSQLNESVMTDDALHSPLQHPLETGYSRVKRCWPGHPNPLNPVNPIQIPPFCFSVPGKLYESTGPFVIFAFFVVLLLLTTIS
jgi:hypothetical protein